MYFRRYYTDPSFLLLLAANVYCLWYYQNHEGGFNTIIWIYWFQSVIIGLFNFLDLLLVKNYDAGSLTINKEPVTPLNKGCTAWFFLVHYGGFHLGYGIFLLVSYNILLVNGLYLLIGIMVFFLEATLAFIRRRRAEATTKVSLGTMFFLPYLRIIPMHLTILLPAFASIKPSILFLLLKTGADIFAYFVYQHLLLKNKTS